MKKVLVTGANGFVGCHLVKALQQKGYQVCGAYREGATFLFRTEGACYQQIDDSFSVDSWSTLLEGVDTVVHLIARTHCDDLDDKEALPLYRKTNVDITKSLLEASKRKSVRRFIYLSSIKAVGEGGDEPYTEETSCAPEDSYGISKREAEILVQSCPEPETVILRPPLIYGSGVKGNLAKLVTAVNRGIPLPFGMLNNARSLVFIGNLIDAIAICVEAKHAGNDIFHVADQESPSTKELSVVISQAFGRTCYLLPVPPLMLRVLGVVLGKEREIHKLTESLVVQTSKITKRLGWAPAYTLYSGIKSLASGHPETKQGT